MLKCKSINKYFNLNHSDDKAHVLDNINLNITDGQIVALKGPSGSGKSTLLNLIAGLDKPSYGEIIINNIDINKLDINKLSTFRNLNIGIVFQFFNLINDLTILENISLPLLLRGVNKKTAENKAKIIIDDLNLLNRINYKTNLLSGGECQRVAIARALIMKPKIILADEPTGNLDAVNSENVMEQLIGNCKNYNTSLLMVTHDESLLPRFDNILTLDSGKIV